MLTIIIPCFNEEKNINKLLERIDEILDKYSFLNVILVDNGSNDSTSKKIKDNIIYKNNKFKLVLVKKNIGYGYGILTGLKASNTEYLSWTHADMQTDIEDIPKSFLLYKDKLHSKKFIIKGRRKNRNKFDSFFTFCMSIISSILTFLVINDVNAQPKIFHRNFYEKLNNPPYDFMLDLYLVIKAKKLNYLILEYPVYFSERKFGTAKGGGSLKGKIILSYKTLIYLIGLRWK